MQDFGIDHSINHNTYLFIDYFFLKSEQCDDKQNLDTRNGIFTVSFIQYVFFMHFFLRILLYIHRIHYSLL